MVRVEVSEARAISEILSNVDLKLEMLAIFKN